MKQIVQNYIRLVNGLGLYIKESGIKNAFIIEKLEMNRITYYRKLKGLKFTPYEILEILRVIDENRESVTENYSIKNRLKD